MKNAQRGLMREVRKAWYELLCVRVYLHRTPKSVCFCFPLAGLRKHLHVSELRLLRSLLHLLRLGLQLHLLWNVCAV